MERTRTQVLSSGGGPFPDRRLLLLATAGALLPSSHALAQTASMRRVVHLGTTSPAAAAHLVAAFVSGLRDLGWTEGRNLVFDTRWAEGDTTRLGPLTDELLALKPDVFVSSTDGNAVAASKATRTVPIVFVIGDDPIKHGVVDSLARPGRNATGYSILGHELGPKRLALLKEALPATEKVGVLFRSGTPTAHTALAALEEAAGRLRVGLIPVGINTLDELATAIQRMSSSGASAMVHVPDALFFLRRTEQIELALQHKLASVYHSIEHARDGALLTYGPDFRALYRRAAALVDRLLKGADPAMIPVEQANVYEFAINLRTARRLNIRFPQSILVQATTVIE
jgi:putative ABC transport system substrate-binding protein